MIVTINMDGMQIRDPNMKKRLGRLFQGIKVNTPFQRAYYLFFVLRRFMLILAGFTLYSMPIF